MPLFTKAIEPFKWYPESIIDSEQKAKKVIKANCYYFYIMGGFSLILGTTFFFFSGYPLSERTEKLILLGIVGILFITLPFIITITKSRAACILLILFVLIYVIHMVINFWVNRIDISLLFWTILVLALKRITVAVFNYNRKKN
jgi:Na+/melibiose symporter-like transporter